MSLQHYRRQIADLRARVERRTQPRAPYIMTPLELFAQTIGGAPDEWQAALLGSDTRQALLNCSRQAGKSTGMAVLAVHTALAQRNALVLLASGSERQSKELLRTVVQVHAACDQGARLLAHSTTRAALANGSRVLALPTNPATVRGFPKVALLIIDEAAYVSDELYRALRPVLAVSGGRIVLGSTPFGKRGFFHQEWTQGGADWQRIEVPATQILRIPADFLAAERRALGDTWYGQEYLCQFADNQFAVFSYESVMAALSDDIRPLFTREDAAAWQAILSD